MRHRPPAAPRPPDCACADAGNLDFQHVAGLHPDRRGAAVTGARRRSRGDDLDTNLMICAIEQIRRSVPVRCISWPFNRVTNVNRVGSPISSAVTMTGPRGAGKLLPEVTENFW
jgi:hypothetical protein